MHSLLIIGLSRKSSAFRCPFAMYIVPLSYHVRTAFFFWGVGDSDAVFCPFHLSFRCYRCYIFLPPIFDVARKLPRNSQKWHDGIYLRPLFREFRRLVVSRDVSPITKLYGCQTSSRNLFRFVKSFVNYRENVGGILCTNTFTILANSYDEPWMPRRNAKNSYDIRSWSVEVCAIFCII